MRGNTNESACIITLKFLLITLKFIGYPLSQSPKIIYSFMYTCVKLQSALKWGRVGFRGITIENVL